MKLAEWDEDSGFPKDYRDFIATTLSAIGGEEQAALNDGTGIDRRVLVAADVALLDCSYVANEADNPPQFQVRVISWDAVPAPTITFRAVMTLSRLAGPTTTTLTLDLKPVFAGEYRKKLQIEGASAFVQAVLAARRPDAPPSAAGKRPKRPPKPAT
jgi:hypothetical protein